MSLSIGIVGLPNVGKSTLFAALTKKQVEIANYPFATIDPNVGIVEVPDERLKQLAELSESKHVVPTVIEFVDIAGLVRGANRGEGLGNKFLSRIREVDAILYLVRAFDNSDIHHVEKSVDPIRDIEIIHTELTLKDLETVEGRLVKVEKESKSGDKELLTQLEFLRKLKETLDNNVHIVEYLRQNKIMRDTDATLLRELQLITAKPAIYLINSSQDDIADDLQKYIEELNSSYLVINAREELDAEGLSVQERKELGFADNKLKDLIDLSYKILGLITFFTTGEDETRAWTTKEGSRAPQAAGVIHSDFEKKFIRAEVIYWNKLLEAGGWALARTKGLLRTEGKDYIIKDGDVLVVLHS